MGSFKDNSIVLHEASEKTWELGMDAHKPNLGLSLFSSSKQNRIGKGYVVKESFVDPLPFIVSSTCLLSFKQVTRSVSHVSLLYLFEFFLRTFNDEEALQAEDVRHFWNHFHSKCSEVEDQQLSKTGVARYISSSQLLMLHVVQDIHHLVYCKWRVKLDEWIWLLLAFCYLNEQK